MTINVALLIMFEHIVSAKDTYEIQFEKMMDTRLCLSQTGIKLKTQELYLILLKM